MVAVIMMLITSQLLNDFLYGLCESNAQGETISEIDSVENASISNLPDATEWENLDIFKILPSEFIFSSGAGAWCTELSVNEDGTFTGQFHDSDMGDFSEAYPNGTVYICNFIGKFSEPIPISTYVYSMKLEYLEIDDTIGDETIIDGIRYISSEAYGFDDAGEFLIYLPGCSLDEITEEFLSWAFINRGIWDVMPMGVYGIYNVGGMQGFIGVDEKSPWRKRYVYSYDGYWSELYLSYESKSYLFFWSEANDLLLSLSFDWKGDRQAEFNLSNAKETEKYHILFDFDEDFNSVMITVKSMSSFDFAPWGGDMNGSLLVEYCN